MNNESTGLTVKNQVEVALEQYETVRQESLESMAHRTQIVSLGLATLGALVGGTLAFHDPQQTTTLWTNVAVFAFAVPLISMSVLFMWMGEVRRMMRAGNFLWSTELIVNGFFSRSLGAKSYPMGWESQYLRGVKDRTAQQMNYPYKVVFITFVLIAFSGVMVAGILAYKTQNLWAISFVAVMFLVAIGAGFFAAKEMLRIKCLTDHETCSNTSCLADYPANEKCCPVCYTKPPR